MSQLSYLNLVWIYLVVTAVYISYKVDLLLHPRDILLTSIGRTQSLLHSSPRYTRTMARCLRKLALENSSPQRQPSRLHLLAP